MQAARDQLEKVMRGAIKATNGNRRNIPTIGMRAKSYWRLIVIGFRAPSAQRTSTTATMSLDELSSASVEPEEPEVELPDELATLSSRIDEKPESFATGNKDIQLAALQAAKYVFDRGMYMIFIYI